ncbi:MAG: hypothetical protein R2744_01575 [Bacteroidales bacterium]
MKSHKLFLLLLVAVTTVRMQKTEEESARFKLLTGQIWTSDSLLVDGEDASYPGGFLEDFAGDADSKKMGRDTLVSMKAPGSSQIMSRTSPSVLLHWPFRLRQGVIELTKQTSK